MKSLLAVSVGPVQDFIAAARRTRDLWFGSWLLSEVSKSIAIELMNRKATLIFPAPGSLAQLQAPGFTVVNKLLAVVEGEDMSKLAAALKEAARSKLLAESKIVRNNIQHRISIDETRFESQLEGMLEVYCCWTPYDHEQHGNGRARVEQMAAGRKALRNFPRYQGQAGQPKSSLDGARENVIMSRSKKVYESNLRPDEILDGLGVLKRFGGEESPKFDSTLDVAGIPFALRVQRVRPQVFQRYQELVRSKLHRLTWTLLYEHESRQVFGDQPEVDDAFRELRDSIGFKPQPPYYALLLGDGDKMGEALSAIDNLERHRQFSAKLSEFASEARGIVEKAQGSPIYTGGDDVMALLPLHTALACATDLNLVFGQKMSEFGACTFSAGMAVAHALEPLSEVRAIAHRAERMAKRDGDRNALAVIVSPRSGAEVAAFGKWGALTGVLNQIIGLYRDEKLSLGLAHEFQDLERRTPRELDDVIIDSARSVAEKKDCSEAADQLLSALHSRAELASLVQAMLVARPFHRAQQEASGK